MNNTVIKNVPRKTKFFKAYLAHNSGTIYINIDHIVSISPNNFSDLTDCKTTISLEGQENYYVVKGHIEDVLASILAS